MKLKLFHRAAQLNDQERIRRLEQKVRLQTITLVLISVGGIIAAWRIQSLYQIIVLFDKSISLHSENIGLITDCLKEIVKLL